MIGALDECVFEGIKTTIPFQQQIFKNIDFQKGNIDTSFLDNFQFIQGEPE